MSPSFVSSFVLSLIFLNGPTAGQTPPGFTPSTSNRLGVTFSNDTGIPYPGAQLSEHDVEFVPRLDLTSLSSCEPSVYLAFMIDIDVARGGCITHLLHWYQPDLALVAKSHELVQTCSNRKKALYGAPAPPGGASHRYLELVFKQPTNFTFPHSFKHYLEPNIPARLFFNITEFATAARLEDPVAANYFTVVGTRASIEEQQIIEL